MGPARALEESVDPARALEESVGPARVLEEREKFRKKTTLFNTVKKEYIYIYIYIYFFFLFFSLQTAFFHILNVLLSFLAER